MEDKKTVRTIKTDTAHNIIMENRHKISVSGVSDVESFNEEEVVLHTAMGGLVVKGQGLHINKLSIEIGEVSLEGDIDGIDYIETKKRPIYIEKETKGFDDFIL